MILRNEIVNSAALQLAVDLNCSAEDFFGAKSLVVPSVINEGRRNFREEPDFFRCASMGMADIVSCSADIEPFAKMICEKYPASELFSAKAMSEINRELFSHHQYISQVGVYYLPRVPYRPDVRHDGYTLSVFEGEELKELYGFEGFEHALMGTTEGIRHDLLAVCAVNGRRIMGIAGAAKDSSKLAQIGIEVLPEFRGMGVGASLVAACANEVFRAGYVPYYGTWGGNIISQRLAAKCAFYPAWCEMFSAPIG